MIIRQKSHPFGWLFCFSPLHSTLYTLHCAIRGILLHWQPTQTITSAHFLLYLRLHLPLSGSLLEATFAKCSPYSKDEKICGLRPRIKRPVVPSRTPVSYPLDTQPPRKYSRSMQPICNKIALES